MHTSPWQTAYWWYEAGYHKWHGLIPVDEFLTVKKTPYRGQPRQLRDGTRIEPGDALLTLHFNNRFLARVQRERGLRSPRQAVMIFGRALMKSLCELHAALRDEAEFADVVAVHGITWFSTHGDSIGFESRPLPQGWRKTLLRWHFRLLLKVLFPHLAARENQRLEPHEFWLSRRQLATRIAGKASHVSQRLERYRPPRLADG